MWTLRMVTCQIINFFIFFFQIHLCEIFGWRCVCLLGTLTHSIITSGYMYIRPDGANETDVSKFTVIRLRMLNTKFFSIK